MQSNKHREKWEAGIASELTFWNLYFQRPSLRIQDKYGNRLDPEQPLDEWLAKLLPDTENVRILDVGAGPLTCLGKIDPLNGRKLEIIPVDPLADEYNALLKRLGITPLIPTINGQAENIAEQFYIDTFDLVYSRNALDHSFDPIKAIDQMIAVLKPGRYLVLDHHMNEGITQNYSGLHQWNFRANDNGDFIISSKHIEVNISEKYRGIHDVRTEITKGNWLVVTTLKSRDNY